MADFASTGRFEKISEHKYKYISDGANFTIEGENFDPNVVKITNNVPIDGGFKIGMSGLNGNVIINGVPTGVFGDNKYVIHGNVYPNSADVMAVIGIGNGATVKGTDGVVVDDNSTVYIGKGSHRLSTITQVQSLNFTVVNFKDDFTLRTINDKFNFAGLPDNYAVTLSAGGNIGEQINFQTGGRGTISVGDTSLIINGDTNFDLKLQNGSIASLENFDGACSIVGSDGSVSDYFVETAIQHKEVVLETKENFATTELSNKLGIKTKVYYTNNDKGGVIDVSNQNLNGEILVAMGKASTIIGSKGNDNLIGRAADSYLVGGAGNDTFRGGAGFRKITVADYVEGEDVVFHGSSFKEVSPLSMAKLDGDDFALSIGPVATVIKNGADKKIKMIDSTGEVTYVGNYWQVQDFDPEKITSTPNVNIIDATARTKDVILIGNDKDNTIISGAGNSPSQAAAVKIPL